MNDENLNRTAWLARVNTEKGLFDEEFVGPKDRGAAEELALWLQGCHRLVPGKLLEVRRPGEPTQGERIAAALRCGELLRAVMARVENPAKYPIIGANIHPTWVPASGVSVPDLARHLRSLVVASPEFRVGLTWYPSSNVFDFYRQTCTILDTACRSIMQARRPDVA